ncbi:ATP-binding protein [Kitasatospora sp. NPDC048407]|uniref:ATP-binding protein n=1 Tax=Kitasatospora sp. NPDC048407 TaxID=3364051 RepID=UPI0037170972
MNPSRRPPPWERTVQDPFRTADLGRAAVDNSVTRAVNKITRCGPIVVDDIGMPPCGRAAADAFSRVIDAAYGRRPVVVTGNLHPSGFDSIAPRMPATAAVDRLPHHARIVLSEGTSLRLAQATAGKGVVPLARERGSREPGQCPGGGLLLEGRHSVDEFTQYPAPERPQQGEECHTRGRRDGELPCRASRERLHSLSSVSVLRQSW